MLEWQGIHDDFFDSFDCFPVIVAGTWVAVWLFWNLINLLFLLNNTIGDILHIIFKFIIFAFLFQRWDL